MYKHRAMRAISALSSPSLKWMVDSRNHFAIPIYITRYNFIAPECLLYTYLLKACT